MTTSHQSTAAGQPMKHQAYHVHLRQYSCNIMQRVEEVPLMVETTAFKASHLPAYHSIHLWITWSKSDSPAILLTLCQQNGRRATGAYRDLHLRGKCSSSKERRPIYQTCLYLTYSQCLPIRTDSYTSNLL